jgi:hypothetical protein
MGTLVPLGVMPLIILALAEVVDPNLQLLESADPEARALDI